MATKKPQGRPFKHGEPLVPVLARIPESLKTELDEAADTAGHPLNDEIITRLRRTTTPEETPDA